jgi:cysteine desulfuration protein SufE
MSDAVQDGIIKEFEGLEWFDKYELLISSAKQVETMAEEFRIEENAISGCQSKVWIRSYTNGDRLHFEYDSDAMITKGIISLVLRVLNGRSAQEILDTDLYFIEEIGLKSNLSPARADGLASIIRRIREIAEEGTF